MNLLDDLKVVGELALRYGPQIMAEVPGIPSELAAPVAAAIKDSLNIASATDRKASIMAVASDALVGVSNLNGMSATAQQTVLQSVSDAIDTTLTTITAIHALKTGTVTPAKPAAPVIGMTPATPATPAPPATSATPDTPAA